MNVEIVAENAKRGDYNSILQLKQFASEHNHYADRVLESIYYDGNKNHAIGMIVLREGITEIKPEEFKNCTKLESVILPESLISIGDSAFEGCFRLQKVFFPDHLKSIGQRAFFGCKSLEKIILPDNVKIDTDAFSGCNQNFSQTQPIQQNISQNVSQSQPVQQIFLSKMQQAKSKSVQQNIYQPVKKNIVYYDGNKNHAVGTIYLREGITKIKDSEFKDCKKFEKVVLPDSLTSIGDDAFERCTALTEINFPDSLTLIGDDAFHGCTALTEIKFPENLTRIGDYVFYNCISLKKITYYKRNKEILRECFYDKWNELQKNVIYKKNIGLLKNISKFFIFS